MSIKAMNWAWEQQLPPVPKLTLLALADNADDHGYCWPKMRTIAAKCCTSERTIQRTIKSLLGTGLLHKAARFDGSGGYRRRWREQLLLQLRIGQRTYPLHKPHLPIARRSLEAELPFSPEFIP